MLFKTLPANFLFFYVFVFSAAAQSPENPSASDVSQIFPADPAKKNHHFHFQGKFEEMNISVSGNVKLKALLFHADSSKGVIFYLHGNTGNLEKWGRLAVFYTGLQLDIFMMDYRGYGESGGTIMNEKQLYEDVQINYDSLKSLYPEKQITIIGYSIGTGPAAMLAATNHPARLILEAPYYSLADAVHHLYPSVDTAEVPFRFATYEYLPAVHCPVFIFHGDRDKTFYYGSSVKLKMYFKPGDELITLKGADHADIEKNSEFQAGIKHVLQ